MSYLDEIFRGGEDIMQGLEAADLDPSQFGPLTAELERPNIQHLKPNVLDFLAPVIHEIASYQDPSRQRRNTWLAPAIRGLTGAYTGYRKWQDEELTGENMAERQRAALVNNSRLAEAKGNRERFGAAVRAQTVDGRLLTRRQMLEQKQKEKADEARATAKARVEGENEARTAEGGLPIGTPATRAEKTPPKPAKFNPNSWKLWSEVDKVTLDAIDEELKQLRNDPVNAGAFRPVRKDRKGNPIPEDASTTAARQKIQELSSRKFTATKNAVMFHLDNLPPGGEAYVFGQLHRLAESAGLNKDPEVEAKFEATAEKLLPKKGK